MPILSIQIRDLLRDFLSEPKTREGYYLTQALIASLSPQQKCIYGILARHPKKFLTSNEIAHMLGKSRNSISNELKRMYDLDVIIRMEQTDENGLHFEYAISV